MIALQQAILTVFLCVVEGGGFMCAEKMPDCVMSTSLSGRLVACRHPVTPPGECCPVCTGRCLHQGEEHPSGSTFTSPSDPCSTCSCVVTCQRRPCPVQCFHPVPSDSCCPDCDSCLYEGVIHAHAHTFTPSYDLCRRCTCVRGTISCVPLACPPTACANPVVRQGQCCPECSGASRNVSWEVDECTSCTCVSGDVHCRTERCPPLTCASVSCRFFCHSWEAIPVKQKHLGFKMYLWI
uniref:VWFC domain-containing protein n=1 Tax=Oryzias melastigma TaxID=30732 RepID=A0A3B3BK42_ORYME